jgi:hypothetical protein
MEQITREELEALRDQLTMADVYRARKSKDEDRGLVAYFEAAKRTGLANGEDLEAFLNRITAADFNAVMSPDAGKAPTAPSGGASEPTSSAGTATDLETSSSSP